VRSEGRLFEVSLEHLAQSDDRPLESQVSSAVRRLLDEGLDGDVLVFLPGALEIRRAAEACASLAKKADLLVLPLHGSLPPAEQDRAVRPADRRKVILSTNVAESSITIDGVRAAVEYIASWGSGAGLRERIVDAMTHISDYEHELAKIYHDAVRSIPGVRVWGPDFAEGRVRAPTVSITLDKATAAEAAKALGDQDICVWDGDFYASRPVQVLGLVERGGLLRTGISMYNTRDEVNRLLAGIEKLA